MQRSACAIASASVCAVVPIASGQIMFFSNEAAFDAAASTLLVAASEDFEGGNVPVASVLTLGPNFDGGVPNVDGGGFGFPTGLSTSAFSLTVVNQGGSGQAVALGSGFIGNSGVVVGANSVGDGLRIDINVTNIRAVGLRLFDGLTAMDIGVLADGGSVSASGTVPAVGADGFFGIVTDPGVDVLSIQLDSAGVAGELLNSVTLYTIPAPAGAGVLVAAGLMAVRRRR